MVIDVLSVIIIIQPYRLHAVYKIMRPIATDVARICVFVCKSKGVDLYSV